ncbi:Gag-Pol polyprotein [Cyphomyrmex costatus]|uniref:Gag-Pol polyprotein n=1 Tax=Cyphomyrmex costatus TaxID=456900 RepID=A0A151ICQ9_9HYME|nr:Gag-Pol polyprotein [Cyphomyrmex costatus]
MQALFDRLCPPWSLPEQLNYAHRNMLPRLQVVIRRDEIYDFASLERMALRVELSHDAATRYRAPPAPEKSLFPDLAYRPPKKNPRTPVVAAAGFSASGNTNNRRGNRFEAGSSAPPATATTDAASATSASSIKCWNCEKTGHRARECKETRRLYCYRCGAADVTIRNCPKCSGNGEAGR